jgi:hypothetical protein
MKIKYDKKNSKEDEIVKKTILKIILTKQIAIKRIRIKFERLHN